MNNIQEYIFINENKDGLKKRKFYEIKNVQLKSLCKKHDNVLLDIKKNKIPENKKCFTDDFYLNILNKFYEDENNYKYYYYVDIKNAYNSTDFNLVFSILKFYIIGFTKFKKLYNFYNNIFSHIQILFNKKNKYLYVGLKSSKILFDILIKHILSNLEFNSNIYRYCDDFLLCNSDKELLLKDVDLLKKALFNYKLNFNKKKSKFIDIKKEKNLSFLNNNIIVDGKKIKINLNSLQLNYNLYDLSNFQKENELLSVFNLRLENINKKEILQLFDKNTFENLLKDKNQNISNLNLDTTNSSAAIEINQPTDLNQICPIYDNNHRLQETANHALATIEYINTNSLNYYNAESNFSYFDPKIFGLKKNNDVIILNIEKKKYSYFIIKKTSIYYSLILCFCLLTIMLFFSF